MIPRNEALELIEGLERASVRTRPFLIWGLILIVVGFVTLSVYLYNQTQEEKARADALKVEAQSLDATLKLAQQHARNLDTDPGARAALLRALRVAINRAGSLEEVVEDAASAAPVSSPAPAERTAPRPERAERAPVPSPTPAPQPETSQAPARAPVTRQVRFVIHIAEASQLGAARALAGTLYANIPARHPGYTMLPVTIAQAEGDAPAGDNSVRCFDLWACDNAERLTGHLNRMLITPHLEMRIMPGAPRGMGVINLQIWFAPGQIRVVPLG